MGKMIHQFSIVPNVSKPRSTFDRSHSLKTTFDSGYLVPIFIDEALPGDTFSLDGELFARLSTPIVPVMDDVYMDTFFFSVPYRLVWEHWEEFITGQKNDGTQSDYLPPKIGTGTERGFSHYGLEDYFGMPVEKPNLTVNAFFHRAYNLIWNEWFRRQFLQEEVSVPTGDGPDSRENYTLLRRAKRHDYFTSANPWPQAGDPVTFSLGDTAPVGGNGFALGLVGYGSDGSLKRLGLGETINSDSLKATTAMYGQSTGTIHSGGDHAANNSAIGVLPTRNGAGELYQTGLVADLSQAKAISINELRAAFQVQRMLELDAIGGRRYVESLKVHFGVTSPDARLQRPEFLGGKSSRIYFQSVPQTSSTGSVNYESAAGVTGGSESVTPQGNLAAFAYGASDRNGFVRSFTEHCLVIGLVNIRVNLSYQQGLDRMHFRNTRLDFYFPEMANIGEQQILNKEIYYSGSDGADDLTFGYQERFAEYRYCPNRITGAFRGKEENDPDTHYTDLQVWHLSQFFENRPVLNSSFIEDKPPIKRILAVQDEPEFLLDCWFDYKCTRPLPVYSIPAGFTRG